MEFDDPEYNRLKGLVDGDKDSFELWERLVSYVEKLDGGITKNSPPEHINMFRITYTGLLEKFPLFYVYWDKFARTEFNIVGVDAAVYLQGTACVSHSVENWLNYITFMTETCHDASQVRAVFESAAAQIGLDFNSHQFWDKYIDFERRMDEQDHIFAILSRIVRIPLYSSSQNYERFRQLTSARPLPEWIPADVLAQMRSEVEQAAAQSSLLNVDSELRNRADNYLNEIGTATYAAVSQRWAFEEAIKRPYFHVTELPQSEVSNWQKYLDFEEQQGDYQQIRSLYERCLIATARYEDFWLRYIRWLQGQANKTEDVRNLFIMASTHSLAIANTRVRHQWALFEEAEGRFDVACDIYEAVLGRMPGHLETVEAWANALRRQKGISAAADMMRGQLSLPQIETANKALILAILADTLSASSVQEGSQAFETDRDVYLDTKEFWVEYLNYEIKHTNLQTATSLPAGKVFQQIMQVSHLDEQSKQMLANTYMDHVLHSYLPNAASEFLSLDRRFNKDSSTHEQ